MLPLQWEHGFPGFSYPKINDLSINFSHFSSLFQNPSRRPFLEAQSADLASKGRFWSHFGILGGPKIDPWSTIFSQKGDFWLPGVRLQSLLGRPGRDMAPKRPQNDPRIDFYRFWNGFWKRKIETLLRASVFRSDVLPEPRLKRQNSSPYSELPTCSLRYTGEQANNLNSISPAECAQRV